MDSRYEEAEELPFLMDLSIEWGQRYCNCMPIAPRGACPKTRRRGSIPGHAVCDRERLDGDYQLYRDYFAQYLSLIVTSLGECVV
jgi:hypothetical protein